MKLIKNAFYFLSFLVTSCQSSPPYVQFAHQEINLFAEEVYKTDDLRLIGSGGGFHDGIDSFSLSFSSPKIASIDDARMLFYNISNRFLNRVNNSELLRPYLVNYPFNIDNLDLIIIFPDIESGKIGGVSMGTSYKHVRKREFVYYSGYSSGEYDTLHKESYQLGLKIYENSEN